ncbi:MAG: ornithine carbamoyltransferase [Candidatus Binatia bacterium]
MAKRDLLNFNGLAREEMEGIFKLAQDLKAKQRRGLAHPLLAHKSLAMIFEKPSLRTRVTFEAGMIQLGGHAIFLGPNEIQLGVRETPADCARSLSRWVDIITVRTFSQKTLEEIAQYASVPVINALTDESHPCQVLADCLTLIEHRGKLDGLKIVFVGDGNNMVNSWMEAAAILPITFALACPQGYEPNPDIEQRARQNGGRIAITHAVKEAASEADVIYTDVWTSMGQEEEFERRARLFKHFQVNEQVLAMAKKEALVMHCLPAHRGQEITHEVLEGRQSIVFDQAENRLHVQKAVMVWLLRGLGRPAVKGFTQ